MPEKSSESLNLLVKADAWQQRKWGRSKLDDAKDAIFHLRYNKHLSYTAIKHFLAESGIKTSTGSLSQFFRSRFPAGTAERIAPVIMTRLADIKSTKDNSQGN